jgi:drug/metabolite transporter (DMT)-like permease
MALRLAYLGVVLIWATTPLAIKWSGESIGYLWAVSIRMTLGLICLLLLVLLTRQRLPWHKAALLTYAAVASQLYAAMLVTYWAAQFIPSGWMSVIFGLSPFFTALMAAAVLRERSLGWRNMVAYGLGVAGLAVMFFNAIELHYLALLGVAGMLLSTLLHAASAVWVKRINAAIAPTHAITGGLLLSVPLYGLTLLLQQSSPVLLPLDDKTLYCILYLGMIATTVGFALYYFVLSKLPATSVAMINLITPVFSLGLGNYINHEAITPKVIIGTALILSALLLHSRATSVTTAPVQLRSKRRRQSKRRGQ